MKIFNGIYEKKADWEKFEIESCLYLNKVYESLPISFLQEGGKSSVNSDIKVYKGQEQLFSIEAKYSPSQSGQFVLVEKNRIYSLSNESKFENNEYTRIIIDYLNENIEGFTPKGQRAININLDQDVLAQWITEQYKRKDSYFIITSTNLSDYKAILPIEEIKNYFDVSAVIRRKRSGTAHVAQYRRESCIKELDEYIEQFGLEISEIITHSKKTLVKFNKDKDFKKSERYFGSNFFLSPNTEGKGYYIKTRSNTNNLNVIFSLVYKGPEENIGIDLLGKFIRKFI